MNKIKSIQISTFGIIIICFLLPFVRCNSYNYSGIEIATIFIGDYLLPFVRYISYKYLGIEIATILIGNVQSPECFSLEYLSLLAFLIGFALIMAIAGLVISLVVKKQKYLLLFIYPTNTKLVWKCLISNLGSLSLILFGGILISEIQIIATRDILLYGYWLSLIVFSVSTIFNLYLYDKQFLSNKIKIKTFFYINAIIFLIFIIKFDLFNNTKCYFTLHETLEKYENGQLRAKGAKCRENINYFKTGQWIFYYENGKTMEIGSFINGIKYGLWHSYYENGKEKESGEFFNGIKYGLWHSYYENGKEKESGDFFYNGKKDGLWRTYYENGNKKESGSFIKGKKDGKWERYHSDGSFNFKCTYKNDVLTGEYQVYCGNNKLCLIIFLNEKGEEIGRRDLLKKSGSYYDTYTGYSDSSSPSSSSSRLCDSISNYTARQACKGICGDIPDYTIRCVCQGDCGSISSYNLRRACQGYCSAISDYSSRKACESCGGGSFWVTMKMLGYNYSCR